MLRRLFFASLHYCIIVLLCCYYYYYYYYYYIDYYYCIDDCVVLNKIPRVFVRFQSAQSFQIGELALKSTPRCQETRVFLVSLSLVKVTTVKFPIKAPPLLIGPSIATCTQTKLINYPLRFLFFVNVVTLAEMVKCGQNTAFFHLAICH